VKSIFLELINIGLKTSYLLLCSFRCYFQTIKCPFIGSWNKQEHEIEYVEGYDELEEEDDIEDFGDIAIAQSHADYDNGKAVTRYLLLSIF
jgi:hypothetical protein